MPTQNQVRHPYLIEITCCHSKNLIWNPRPLCDPKTCHACVNGVHLKSAQRGNDRGKDNKIDQCNVHELHALPEALTEEILQVCESTLT